MGVDLDLLPLREGEGCYSSFSILECDRAGDLFADVRKLPQTRAPRDLNTFRPDNSRKRFGPTTEDMYGSPINCTTAEQLLTLKDHERIKSSATNRAVWAYLSQLSPKTLIALYWH